MASSASSFWPRSNFTSATPGSELAPDAFSGALAACVAAGAPVEDALLVASAAGALTCMRRGAVDAMPTREEVLALMARHGRRLSPAWGAEWIR